jgi:hypothetical protein
MVFDINEPRTFVFSRVYGTFTVTNYVNKRINIIKLSTQNLSTEQTPLEQRLALPTISDDPLPLPPLP